MDNNCSNLSTDSFITFLNSEIDQIQKSIQLPGWTLWAILLSTATVVWLILSEIESYKYSITSIIYYLLIISFIADTFFFIRVILYKPPTSSDNRLRYLNDYFSTYRILDSLLYVCRYLFVIVSIIAMFNIINRYTLYSSVMLGIFQVFLFLFSIFLHSIRLPIITEPSKKNVISTVTPALYLILSSLSLIGLIGLINSVYFPFSFIDLRLAILISALFFLLAKLLAIPSSDSSLNTLIRIRRDVLFGKLPLELAVKQADIILSGLKYSELIQDKVNAIIENYNYIIGEYSIISDKYDSVSSILKSKSESLTHEDVIIIKSVIESFSCNFSNMDKYINQLETSTKSFEFHQRYFKNMNIPVDKDIVEKISEAREERVIKYNQMRDKWNDLKNSIDELTLESII